jgi:glycosyltransferase involved in cell wall biosynthesis
MGRAERNMKVSALVLTYNEELNLPRCLEALRWCDDVVVVDSGSLDKTVEIAQSFGARVLARPFDTFADQRNFGLEAGDFRHEWVLHLDADEVVTPEFKGALEQLEPTKGVSAFRVPSKLMLYERWLRHAGMYPTYQVRLGHRDRLRFKQVGHGQREALPASAVATFDEPYLHYNFSHGFSAWLVKHVRYARDEAKSAISLHHVSADVRIGDVIRNKAKRRHFAKALAGRIPWAMRPVLRFFYIWLIRQGFRDGRAGLVYAIMLSVYEGMIAVFGYEQVLRREVGRPPVDGPTGADGRPIN